MTADQGKIFTEFRPVEVEQHGAVADLLLGHFVEHLGGVRIFSAQALGEPAVDTAVLVLVGDGEGENFLLSKFGKAFHVRPRI